MGKGYWEVQDDKGEWHKVTGFQAASYRAYGATVRFVEE